jgi:hypothetical protein
MKLHRYFQVVAITLALILANSAPAYCQSPQNNPASAPQIQRVKNQVLKIGVGEDITVILFSGVEYYGAISKIEPDSFEIKEVDLRQTVAIAYADVQGVEKGYGPMDSSTGMRQKRHRISNQKISKRSFWIFMAVGIASTVGFGIWAASKVKKPQPAGPFPRIP